LKKEFSLTLDEISLRMKNFKRQTFFIITLLFGVVLVPSFLTTWAFEDGTVNKNSFWQIFVSMFSILRFPTHTLFWNIFGKSGVLIYFFGLLLNCCFYGLIIERIIYLIKISKN
jgi:hypothetical protein